MATKKPTSAAKVDPMSKVFDICPFPGESKFEQEYFANKSGVAYSRFIVETINRVRQIDSDLNEKNSIFSSNTLTAERNRLMTFLEEEGADNIESAVLNFEELEKQYWVSTLGKRAAVEILSAGKISVETMDKMIRLPEDLYIKATQICVKLANAVDATTRQAEEDVGIRVVAHNTNVPDEGDGMPELSSSPKKGIRLKKVKK